MTRCVWLVVLALAGCDGKMKALQQPDPIVWKPDYGYTKRFEVRGQPKMMGELNVFRQRLVLTAWHLPKKMRVDLGAASSTTSDEGSVHVEESLGKQLAALPADVLGEMLGTRPLDPGLSMVFHTDGGPVTVKLPPMTFSVSSDLFAVKLNEGMLFGDEKPRAGPPRNVYVPSATLLVGNAATLGDIDAIALTVPATEKGTKVCGGYQDVDGRARSVKLRLVDTEVTVLDRRTGKPLAKQVFPPDETCPVAAAVGRDGTHDSSVPGGPIRAWLTAFLGGEKPSEGALRPVFGD